MRVHLYTFDTSWESVQCTLTSADARQTFGLAQDSAVAYKKSEDCIFL